MDENLYLVKLPVPSFAQDSFMRLAISFPSTSIRDAFFATVAILATVFCMFVFPNAARGIVQDAPQSPDGEIAGKQELDAESDRIGHLVRIPLPIDSKVSANVRQTLQQLAEKSQVFVRPEDRPVVVLEFDTTGGKTGRGSELEACMALARYLGDPILNRFQTVVYIPASRGVVDLEADQFNGQLNGHAVLVAIAANQIVLEPNTAIGFAGIDEKRIEPLVREVYKSVANQRLTLPVPIVMSMLDKELQLFRVTTKNRGVLYVDGQELKKLEASGEGVETLTICKRGEFARLSGEQLANYRLIRLTPSSRTELARMLDLSPNSLEGNPVQGGNWTAVQFSLPEIIDQRTAQWIVRSLKQQVASKSANLIIFDIDNNSGDIDACLRIAQHLADYDPNKIRTVAFVRDTAKGPVGLIALSCSHLIMAPEARLGGVDELNTQLDESDFASLEPMVKAIAENRQKDWSIMVQMIKPQLAVTRYRHKESGQVRLLSGQEFEALNEPEQWAVLGPIGGASGIDAQTAERNYLVRTIAEDMGQIQTFYQLENPPKPLRPSATDRWIERVAGFLSSPLVSPWLLFAAMFFFSTEMSAPGLGLPGFLATVCFVLFFWSQSLDGNADWLEIILFLVGVVFVMMEIFILPGFGIFGIGGLLMVITSLVLASQSFLIPRTNEELAQIPYSLLPVLGAGFGVIVGAVALRKVLPHSPYLRRMMLEPQTRVDTGLENGSDPEALVDWSHLAGQPGEAITRLVPSGKARISGRVYDVISTGQMVSKGQQIEVVEARGNRVVVRAVE